MGTIEPVKTTSKPRIGQTFDAIGIVEGSRKVGKRGPEVALVVGFVLVFGAIFGSALCAVDLETFAELVVLFAVVGAMFPVDAVLRVVGE